MCEAIDAIDRGLAKAEHVTGDSARRIHLATLAGGVNDRLMA